MFTSQTSERPISGRQARCSTGKPNKRAPGEEEAKVLRPQNGGYYTKPTDSDGAESSLNTYRANQR